MAISGNCSKVHNLNYFGRRGIQSKRLVMEQGRLGKKETGNRVEMDRKDLEVKRILKFMQVPGNRELPEVYKQRRNMIRFLLF